MSSYLKKVHKIWFRFLIAVATGTCLVSVVASDEIVLGEEQAPVTLIEYGSMTCDYCIHFHRKVLPQVKSQYIDTGKVRFIYRHFPTSEAAMRGALATQCSSHQYYAMLDKLYETVATWYQVENRKNIFTLYAESLGLEAEPFRACLDNKQYMNDIVNAQRQANIEYDVRGTPTFIINRRVVSGEKSFDELAILIDEALRKQ